jgi:hypothetical protein
MMTASQSMDRQPVHGTRCTATNRRGERCGRFASPGRPTCVNHGGKSPVGAANPAYTHGRYSKLPAAIHADYLAAKADPNFLSVADELHVLRALASELAGGLGVDVVAVRREVGAAWDGFQQAKAGGNVPRMKEAMAKLEAVIEEAKGTTAKMNELIVTFDNIRKLSDTETKRIVLAKEMLTREQAQHLVQLVQQCVLAALAEVRDDGDRKKALSTFTDSLVRLQVGGLR